MLTLLFHLTLATTPHAQDLVTFANSLRDAVGPAWTVTKVGSTVTVYRQVTTMDVAPGGNKMGAATTEQLTFTLGPPVSDAAMRTIKANNLKNRGELAKIEHAMRPFACDQKMQNFGAKHGCYVPKALSERNQVALRDKRVAALVPEPAFHLPSGLSVYVEHSPDNIVCDDCLDLKNKLKGELVPYAK